MNLRPLPPINEATGRPYRCVTHQAHDCDGNVVGAVGAIPCCAAGAEVETAAVEADRARIARFVETHRAELDAEARREMEWEARANRY